MNLGQVQPSIPRAESVPNTGSKYTPCPPTHLQAALSNVLLFNNLDPSTQIRIVAEMYEKQVAAGDILIQQGDTGVVASQLFVVKSGKFEVGSWLSNATGKSNCIRSHPRLSYYMVLSCKPGDWDMICDLCCAWVFEDPSNMPYGHRLVVDWCM